jgi:glycine/D-amino acid oxidase-like deaminating enzyme
MGSVSLWQDEGGVFADEPAPALSGAAEAEVAVIGGGITGVAAALWLARQGADVALLEARRIAAGASGRNGGFLLGGTSESYAATAEHYGRETARRVWAYTVANRQRARDLVAELEAEGWPCGYRQGGSLLIAATEKERAEHMASHALLREDGWQVDLLDRDGLPPILRGSYQGALYFPSDGEIQPARFVRGLAARARAAGARFHEQTPVTAVTATPDGFAISAADTTLRARTLLLATNAWLPDLGAGLGAQWLTQAISPTRGQMLSTAPLEARLFECPCYADEGYQYWRQLADGRLAVGGWRNRSFESEDAADETPHEAVQSHLDRFLGETLHLPELAVEHRWAGIMAFSADGLPLIGALPGIPGGYVAGGYTGHGNAYALHAAWIVAERIAGRQPADADLFDPGRFAATPPPASALPATGHA